MASLQYFFFFIFFFFPPHIASTIIFCEPSFCGTGPLVQFPFRFKHQPKACGYTGFDLSCTNQSQTILTLPHSGDFFVQKIDYSDQTIDITDPDNCFIRRTLQNFTLSGSPFQNDFSADRNFTLFNCSSNVANMYSSWPISCLSGDGFNVSRRPTVHRESFSPPASCRAIFTGLLPAISSQSVQLTWNEPSCLDCVARGGDCERSDTILDDGCFTNAPSSFIGTF